MFGLPLVDIVVIAVYFGIILAIGVWASRRVRGEEDFFLAGRRFGKFIQTFATFLVWGYATRDLLGPLGFGLVGLMIACLMAALMSTADCLMLTSSSLLTHNLYRVAVPGRGARHYVWVGRVAGALVLIGSAWIALQFDTILQILKFIWEMNVSLVPAFWLGMKWRRANRWGAWISILYGMVAFLALPLLLPTFFPALRTRSDLLKRTDPAPLVRTYDATAADVRVRETGIRRWQALHAAGEDAGPSPEPLAVGQSFTRTHVLPRKGIFWTQGVVTDMNGALAGQGALSLELVLLDRLGWDLSSNPYAFNETLRILIRTLTPILLMGLTCLMTPRDKELLLKRFYAKMRTRVAADRDADAAGFAVSIVAVFGIPGGRAWSTRCYGVGSPSAWQSAHWHQRPWSSVQKLTTSGPW